MPVLENEATQGGGTGGEGLILAASRPRMGRTWGGVMGVLALLLIGSFWIDQRVAAWAMDKHPIPDLVDPAAKHGDGGRELMHVEQFGQVVSSVLVIAAVALIDKQGVKRALAIGIACGAAAIACHLLKDVLGRNRPGELADAAWQFWGPGLGFTKGSKYGSMPSAHTVGAFSLAIGLAWYYPRGRALFYGLACAVAAMRILHHAHYVSDVLAGVLLAMLVAGGTLKANLADKILGKLSAPR